MATEPKPSEVELLTAPASKERERKVMSRTPSSKERA